MMPKNRHFTLVIADQNPQKITLRIHYLGSKLQKVRESTGWIAGNTIPQNQIVKVGRQVGDDHISTLAFYVPRSTTIEQIKDLFHILSSYGDIVVIVDRIDLSQLKQHELWPVLEPYITH